jgi:hypothetical protein
MVGDVVVKWKREGTGKGKKDKDIPVTGRGGP